YQRLLAGSLGTHEDGRLHRLPPRTRGRAQLHGLSQMNTTRRYVIQFAGGAALGGLFTAAPWRLITDSALLSENWPGIPQPAHGEIRTKFTTCALCDAGCPVKARCVGDQPVALTGIRGGLCPFGVTGHHLPYHPARLRKGPVEEAKAAYAMALAK